VICFFLFLGKYFGIFFFFRVAFRLVGFGCGGGGLEGGGGGLARAKPGNCTS
jgi:hypothetical protein